MSNNFPALLEERRPDIEKLLPSWLRPEHFFSLAMQIYRTPELMNCTPESLLDCVYQAAQMGLEYGPRGHIYAIAYGKQAQAQPGWRGLAFLRLQAGAVLSIDTDVVFQCDNFKVGRSSAGDVFEHLADYKGDRDEPSAYAAYARVKLPDGTYQFEIQSRDSIMRHRQHSKQPNGLLWTKFWEEGWRKTAYRVLDKRLPEGVNKEAIERYAFATRTEARAYRKDDIEDADPGELTEAETPRARVDNEHATRVVEAAARAIADVDERKDEDGKEGTSLGTEAPISDPVATGNDYPSVDDVTAVFKLLPNPAAGFKLITKAVPDFEARGGLAKLTGPERKQVMEALRK